MWGNLLSVIVGGVLAMGGAVVAAIVRHRLEDGRTKRALAGAFAGEISAICASARRRDYAGHLEQILAGVRASGESDSLVLRITHDYFQVYRSNAGALGMLPINIAEELPLFYTQVQSLLEDVELGAFTPSNADEAERQLVEQIKLLKDTLGLGDDLVKRLREVRS